MSLDSQARVAQLPIIAQQDVLALILRTADECRLWSDLLPMTRHMTAEARRTAARIVGNFPTEVLERLVSAADSLELWPDLIGIVESMPDEERARAC